MSNSSNHTPTPWKPSRRQDAIVVDSMEDEFQAQASIKHYGGYVVAESLSEGDRAFVLRACNSHEQLVAALKLAQQGLAQVGVLDHLVDYDANERAVNAVRAALAAEEA